MCYAVVQLPYVVLYGLGQLLISLDCTMNIIIAIQTSGTKRWHYTKWHFTPPMEGKIYVHSDTTFPLPWRENFVWIKFPLCN